MRGRERKKGESGRDERNSCKPTFSQNSSLNRGWVRVSVAMVTKVCSKWKQTQVTKSCYTSVSRAEHSTHYLIILILPVR